MNVSKRMMRRAACLVAAAMVGVGLGAPANAQQLMLPGQSQPLEWPLSLPKPAAAMQSMRMAQDAMMGTFLSKSLFAVVMGVPAASEVDSVARSSRQALDQVEIAAGVLIEAIAVVEEPLFADDADELTDEQRKAIDDALYELVDRGQNERIPLTRAWAASGLIFSGEATPEELDEIGLNIDLWTDELRDATSTSVSQDVTRKVAISWMLFLKAKLEEDEGRMGEGDALRLEATDMANEAQVQAVDALEVLTDGNDINSTREAGFRADITLASLGATEEMRLAAEDRLRAILDEVRPENKGEAAQVIAFSFARSELERMRGRALSLDELREALAPIMEIAESDTVPDGFRVLNVGQFVSRQIEVDKALAALSAEMDRRGISDEDTARIGPAAVHARAIAMANDADEDPTKFARADALFRMLAGNDEFGWMSRSAAFRLARMRFQSDDDQELIFALRLLAGLAAQQPPTRWIVAGDAGALPVDNVRVYAGRTGRYAASRTKSIRGDAIGDYGDAVRAALRAAVGRNGLGNVDQRATAMARLEPTEPLLWVDGLAYAEIVGATQAARQLSSEDAIPYVNNAIAAMRNSSRIGVPNERQENLAQFGSGRVASAYLTEYWEGQGRGADAPPGDAVTPWWNWYRDTRGDVTLASNDVVVAVSTAAIARGRTPADDLSARLAEIAEAAAASPRNTNLSRLNAQGWLAHTRYLAMSGAAEDAFQSAFAITERMESDAQGFERLTEGVDVPWRSWIFWSAWAEGLSVLADQAEGGALEAGDLENACAWASRLEAADPEFGSGAWSAKLKDAVQRLTAACGG